MRWRIVYISLIHYTANTVYKNLHLRIAESLKTASATQITMLTQKATKLLGENTLLLADKKETRSKIELLIKDLEQNEQERSLMEEQFETWSETIKDLKTRLEAKDLSLQQVKVVCFALI